MSGSLLVALLPVLELAMLALHELGHYVAARALGLEARFGVRWYCVLVVRISTDDMRRRPGTDAAIALAGPTASFLGAVALWPSDAALLSAAFGAIALLPLPLGCQDGYRAARTLARMGTSCGRASQTRPGPTAVTAKGRDRAH